MARTKQIILGLNNGQKFRFIIRHPEQPNTIDFAMTMTIQEFYDKVASSSVRQAVETTLVKLGKDRWEAKKIADAPAPTGLLTDVNTFTENVGWINLHVQVDLF